MTPERIAELRGYADPDIYALAEGAPPEYLGEALDEIERLRAVVCNWKARRADAVSDVSPGTFDQLADAERALANAVEG